MDLIWNEDGRPAIIYNPIYCINETYAGMTWEQKIELVMSQIENDYDAKAFVITALDEIGWLFNLRGFDIPYNPGIKLSVG